MLILKNKILLKINTYMSDENKWDLSSAPRKKITLHDVARHVGVSKSTVSLVLQQSPSVHKKTRERVLKGIEETGYVYNRNAAGLRKTGNDGLIGVIVNAMNTGYTTEFMRALESSSLQQNILPMFASSGELLAQQDKLLRLYMEHNVSGFIICPAPGTTNAMLDKIWRNGFPIVQVMREVAFNQFPAVIADNRKGTHEATEHLIDQGHKKIAFLGGTEEISDYHERLAGFMDAMNDAGLKVPSSYIVPVLQSRAAGRDAIEQVLKYDKDITAVMCFSDIMAYGVLSKARELGIEIGKDLAVIGFDDLPDSSLTYPSLTTVSIKASELAENALELLQKYIKERQTPAIRKVLPVELVVRESSGFEETK